MSWNDVNDPDTVKTTQALGIATAGGVTIAAASAVLGLASATLACGVVDVGPAVVLHGNTVRCCYVGEFDVDNSNIFCLQNDECIENGDETAGPSEEDIADFCALKCPAENEWPVSTFFQPAIEHYYDPRAQFPLTYLQEIFFPGYTYLDACDGTLPAGGLSNETMSRHVGHEITGHGNCTPKDPILFGLVGSMGPGLGAFASDRDGSMDIDVAGASLVAEYELHAGLRLADCDEDGIDGGTCTLVLATWEMDIHDIEVSGGEVDFGVPNATLRLSQAAVAEVTFDECDVSSCYGEFSFSDAGSNPLSFDLQWLQINPGTSHTAVAGLNLANDGDGLGGLDTVYGSVLLDLTGSSGAINLVGSGSDSFGGDFAEADFSIFGYVETIDLDVGDCCEEQETSGCSNSYIKTCVCTHDPDCCSQEFGAEWDETCVAEVDMFGCGVCE